MADRMSTAVKVNLLPPEGELCHLAGQYGEVQTPTDPPGQPPGTGLTAVGPGPDHQAGCRCRRPNPTGPAVAVFDLRSPMRVGVA